MSVESWFFGCYELQNFIGCGGMVDVWKVCDYCFGCDVVVKKLCIDFVSDDIF